MCKFLPDPDAAQLVPHPERAALLEPVRKQLRKYLEALDLLMKIAENIKEGIEAGAIVPPLSPCSDMTLVAQRLFEAVSQGLYRKGTERNRDILDKIAFASDQWSGMFKEVKNLRGEPAGKALAALVQDTLSYGLPILLETDCILEKSSFDVVLAELTGLLLTVNSI